MACINVSRSAVAHPPSRSWWSSLRANEMANCLSASIARSSSWVKPPSRLSSMAASNILICGARVESTAHCPPWAMASNMISLDLSLLGRSTTLAPLLSSRVVAWNSSSCSNDTMEPDCGCDSMSVRWSIVVVSNLSTLPVRMVWNEACSCASVGYCSLSRPAIRRHALSVLTH